MKYFKKLSVLLALLFSSISFISSNVYAAPDPFANASCLGGNNVICVQEISTQSNNQITGQYQITNNSGQEIFMFGVTNSNAKNAFSTINNEIQRQMGDSYEIVGYEYDYDNDMEIPIYDYVPVYGYFTDRWQGKTITKDQWNNSDQFFGAFASGALSAYYEGAQMYQFNGRDLGTFESLFGSEDTSVNIYWHINSSDLNPFTYGSLNGFYWNDSPPTSQFTAFGTDGKVLATTVGASVAAVPEPETYGMMLLGLGLLGFASRRKQA